MKNFEKDLARLESICNTMRGGGSDLAQSVRLFEEGIGLVRRLEKTLHSAERKVEILINEPPVGESQVVSEPSGGESPVVSEPSDGESPVVSEPSDVAQEYQEPQEYQQGEKSAGRPKFDLFVERTTPDLSGN